MKYFVEINGTRHEVDVDGANATISGVSGMATLAPANGAPVRIMRIGDRVVRVLHRRGEGKGVYLLDIDGYSYATEAVDERTRVIRDMTAKAGGAAGPAPLKAPMPGLIVRVNVVAGDVVQAGQWLVVMEAMKMENELRATAAGTVKAVHATPGSAVEKGALLVELV